ncbi:MAG TPA: extracellular solute-binding protein [Streptosporangiaceae bacterium]|nr:extracellular solute-binding protein [Streptosporangiaceae bacterium]
MVGGKADAVATDEQARPVLGSGGDQNPGGADGSVSRRSLLRAGIGGGALLAGGALAGCAPGTASSGGKSKATLRMWTWYTEDAKTFPRLIAEYESSHPHVSIQNRIIDFNSYAPALESAVSAGDVPEIFAPGVLAVTYGKGGIALDLKQALGESFLSQFFPSTNAEYSSGSGQYAVGWEAQTFGVFYNPELFKKAKIDIPETWDDLIATVEPLKRAGLICCAFNGTPSASVADFFLPLITQVTDEPELVIELDRQTGRGKTWNIPPVVEALGMVKKVFDAGVFNPGALGTQTPEQEQLFYTGKAAMNWEGSWMPADLLTEAPKSFLDAYDVFPNPAWVSGGRHWTPNQAGSGLALSAKSPYAGEAVAFLKWLYEPERYAQVMNETASMPSTLAAAPLVSNPIVRKMTSYLTDGDGCPHIMMGVGSQDAAGNGAELVIKGSSTPAQAAAQIQAAVVQARQQV